MINTGTHQATAIDALGVTIRTGDTVTVLHHGHGVRLDDCGRRAEVVSITRTGNLRLVGARHYDQNRQRSNSPARTRGGRPTRRHPRPRRQPPMNTPAPKPTQPGTAHNPRLCFDHFAARHGWEPAMGDGESLFEPGICDQCGADQIVFWIDP